jgi:hypothetical protein
MFSGTPSMLAKQLYDWNDYKFTRSAGFASVPVNFPHKPFWGLNASFICYLVEGRQTVSPRFVK